MFHAVLTVLIVLLLAYWCTRLLAKQWVRSSGSGNIQIVEQLQLGQNQKILLLKIGESNYLIGVSQAGIQFLAKVEGDFKAEALQPAADQPVQLPFHNILEEYLTRHQKKKGGDK